MEKDNRYELLKNILKKQLKNDSYYSTKTKLITKGWPDTWIEEAYSEISGKRKLAQPSKTVPKAKVETKPPNKIGKKKKISNKNEKKSASSIRHREEDTDREIGEIDSLINDLFEKRENTHHFYDRKVPIIEEERTSSIKEIPEKTKVIKEGPAFKKISISTSSMLKSINAMTFERYQTFKPSRMAQFINKVTPASEKKEYDQYIECKDYGCCKQE